MEEPQGSPAKERQGDPAGKGQDGTSGEDGKKKKPKIPKQEELEEELREGLRGITGLKERVWKQRRRVSTRKRKGRPK